MINKKEVIRRMRERTFVWNQCGWCGTAVSAPLDAHVECEERYEADYLTAIERVEGDSQLLSVIVVSKEMK